MLWELNDWFHIHFTNESKIVLRTQSHFPQQLQIQSVSNWRVSGFNNFGEKGSQTQVHSSASDTAQPFETNLQTWKSLTWVNSSYMWFSFFLVSYLNYNDLQWPRFHGEVFISVMRRNVTLLSWVFQSPHFCSGSCKAALMLIILTSHPGSERLHWNLLAETSILELWFCTHLLFFPVERAPENRTVEMWTPSTGYRHFHWSKLMKWIQKRRSLECHCKGGAGYRYFR